MLTPAAPYAGRVDFRASVASIPSLTVVPEVGSTNAELASRANEAPNYSVLATTNQTDGRGRLGRSWTATKDTSLAVSVLLRPSLPDGEPLGLGQYGWLPLIAGAAMTRTVASLLDGPTAALKWPNDVLIGGRKVAGLLAELLPGEGVILGAGLNLTMTEEQLPVPTATSLALNGVALPVDELADLALSRYFEALVELVSRYLDAGADAGASGIHTLVSDLCSTLGQDVRVELPGAADLVGSAVGLDDTGRLRVRWDGGVQAVAAGDVTHLRYE